MGLFVCQTFSIIYQIYPKGGHEINFTNGMEYYLDLNTITGYDLDFAYIKFGKIIEYAFSPETHMDVHLRSSFINANGDIDYRHGMVELFNGGSVNYITSNEIAFYDGTNQNHLRFWNSNGSIRLQLSITAQFPD